ncbi:hypothetical protein Tdes44962_MAKER07299 [Teratosphaeria destructans]|uniref:Uncharacterized protein n=1 Tax=Teratosphaeria destructans TaxID=418781 RepID=A0A9W7SZX3_9PEZI|nr:hypothetical protein Tdes44962_MAKER07299 [Teratosphaeria destructans]
MLTRRRVSLRETTGADALDDVFISPRQRGIRHHGSDTTNAVASGVEGHEYITTPPRHVPSPTGTVASISSTKRTPSRPSIAGANVLSPREELARSESARRNFMPPSFSDATNATDPDLNLLAPGFGSETAALRASKRLSAQNLQAMFEQGEDAQNDINKLLAEEMKRQKEDVNNLVQLARVQRRRVNTVQERTEQLEQFTVEMNADLQRRLAAVEEQMTAMRVRSAQTTPVLDQFGQFLPGVSYSHPGHLQPPPIHNHPAFQPRSQHSSQAPGGQRNFHVNMMQMPAPSFNVQEPLQLAPGLETPKAKIITMPASGARIDGDKPSAVTPNPTDDVFGPRAPAAPSAPVAAGPSYGACAPGPLPKAQFGQKTFRELLSSLYSRSEMAVRQYFCGNFQVRNRDPRAVHLFKLAHTHLNGKQAAENMLAEPDTRVYLFIGMVHEWLVTNIYHQALLDGYADAPSAVRINELFNKEAWYQQSGAIYAMEFGRRRQLATERTSLCQKVAQQPGFWKWVQQVSTALSDEFLTTFSLVIPVHLLPRARDEFHKIIHDVTKVAVRMRQEPFFFEIIFYRFGVRWDHKRMIQRNDEFLGLAMDEDPPQHVVRATLVPCVIQKGFEGNTLQMEQILKGEVVLTDRQGNLR